MGQPQADPEARPDGSGGCADAALFLVFVVALALAVYQLLVEIGLGIPVGYGVSLGDVAFIVICFAVAAGALLWRTGLRRGRTARRLRANRSGEIDAAEAE